MKTYVKIAETVEAVLWDGLNYEEVSELVNGECYIYNACLFVKSPNKGNIVVNRGEFIVMKNGQVGVWTKDRFLSEYKEAEA